MFFQSIDAGIIGSRVWGVNGLRRQSIFCRDKASLDRVNPAPLMTLQVISCTIANIVYHKRDLIAAEPPVCKKTIQAGFLLLITQIR